MSRQLIEKLKLMKSVLICMFLILASTSSFGQYSDALQGNYIDSALQKKIFIENDQFVINSSFYDYYGQPNTTETFNYSLKYKKDGSVKIRLKKYRGVSHPFNRKRKKVHFIKMGISSPYSRNYEGTYTVVRKENGTVYLEEVKSKKSITLIHEE